MKIWSVQLYEMLEFPAMWDIDLGWFGRFFVCSILFSLFVAAWDLGGHAKKLRDAFYDCFFLMILILAVLSILSFWGYI